MTHSNGATWSEAPTLGGRWRYLHTNVLDIRAMFCPAELLKHGFTTGAPFCVFHQSPIRHLYSSILISTRLAGLIRRLRSNFHAPRCLIHLLPCPGILGATFKLWS